MFLPKGGIRMKTKELISRVVAVCLSVLLMSAVLISYTDCTYATTSTAKNYEYHKNMIGAFKISATSSAPADFYVYKSKKAMRNDNPCSKKYNIKKYSYTAKVSGSNTYYVKIKVRNNKRATFTCKYSEYKDSKESAAGGYYWVKDDKSYGNVLTGVYVTERIYFSKEDVPKAIAKVATDSNLKLESYLTSITWNASLSFFSMGGKPASVLAGMMSVGSFKGFSFNKVAVDQVKSKSGYHKTSKGAKADYGICLVVYYGNNTRRVDVKRWNGTTMKGEPGLYGSWKKWK